MKNLKYISLSEKQDWETPDHIFDPINDIFNFDLDACASNENKKCKNYFTISDNCLTVPWKYKSVWLNPPYSRANKTDPQSGTLIYIKKAFEEVYFQKNSETVVLLIPNTSENTYYHDYIFKSEYLLFIRSRISFISLGKAQAGNTKGSVISIMSTDRNLKNKINKLDNCNFGHIVRL